MLYTSSSLPLSKITLDDWQLVKVSGVDSTKFLQGQLTVAIDKLTDSHYLFSAQCDPKGKVWSNMLLFKRGDDIYYIERKSVLALQLKELKKFAVFSKVTIEADSSLAMVGLAGKFDNDTLTDIAVQFNDAQNCITVNHITYLKLTFPQVRYIAIGAPSDLEKIPFTKQYLQQNSDQWALLDMEANYPIIDVPVSNQYLPQAFNLQNFAAISFDKGCYCGQEMVARAQYRGINKRALYLLVGQSESLAEIGDTLEQKMGENWRETGTVLATLKLNDNTVWVQAILNNDLEADTEFRIKNSVDSKLAIKK